MHDLSVLSYLSRGLENGQFNKELLQSVRFQPNQGAKFCERKFQSRNPLENCKGERYAMLLQNLTFEEELCEVLLETLSVGGRDALVHDQYQLCGSRDQALRALLV